MKHLKTIFTPLLLIAMCAFSMTSIQSCSSQTTTNESSQVEESVEPAEPQLNFYGFDENEVNDWINRAMNRKNCELVRITSTEMDGGWLIIHADVKEYNLDGRSSRDNKAEIQLHKHPQIHTIDEGRCYLEIK